MKIFIIISVTFIFSAILSSCDGIFPTAPKDALPADHTKNLGGVMHKESENKIKFDDCTDCHTDNIKGMTVKINGVYTWTPSCIQCHGRLWEREDGQGEKVNNN